MCFYPSQCKKTFSDTYLGLISSSRKDFWTQTQQILVILDFLICKNSFFKTLYSTLMWEQYILSSSSYWAIVSFVSMEFSLNLLLNLFLRERTCAHMQARERGRWREIILSRLPRSAQSLMMGSTPQPSDHTQSQKQESDTKRIEQPRWPWDGIFLNSEFRIQ